MADWVVVEAFRLDAKEDIDKTNRLLEEILKQLKLQNQLLSQAVQKK